MYATACTARDVQVSAHVQSSPGCHRSATAVVHIFIKKTSWQQDACNSHPVISGFLCCNMLDIDNTLSTSHTIASAVESDVYVYNTCSSGGKSLMARPRGGAQEPYFRTATTANCFKMKSDCNDLVVMSPHIIAPCKPDMSWHV